MPLKHQKIADFFKTGTHLIPLCSQKNTSTTPCSNCDPLFLTHLKIHSKHFGRSLTQGTKKATVSFPSHPLRMSFVKTGCLRETGWQKPAARWWFWSLKMDDEIRCVTFFPTTWVHRKWWFCFRYLIRFTETNLQNKEQHSTAGFFPNYPFLHQRYTSLPSTMNAASPKATWEKIEANLSILWSRKMVKIQTPDLYPKPCRNL